MSELRFDGRVAVVTGAGGGLGKAYALLLGSRGAKVVVNDLGSGRHGDGQSGSAADAVVQEIKSKGGEAVADYNSVVEGEKIIKTAIDNFGRIDILINNAGILRDRSFQKISDQDWDIIQAVHVKGAFKTTQAAWEHFKNQKFGRVIVTASNAGIYGNFGQANYSTAKLGLVGLANTLAIEGAKYNIKVNTIVPTAASRLTEDILPPDLFQEMKPELIAPVVAYMVHESFPDNGIIIDSAVGFATKVHFVRGNGAHVRKQYGAQVSVEDVQNSWGKVVDMTGAKHFNTISDVTVDLMNQLQFLKDTKPDGKYPSVWGKYSYNSKDCILYALGVGASTTKEDELKYIYENHENFAPLPSFFVLVSGKDVLESSIVSDAMPPGKAASFQNILHGEQYLEIVDEIPPPDANLVTRSYVVDVLDKGKGTVVITANEAYLGGKVVVRGQSSIYVVGQGNWGGPRDSSAAVQPLEPPKRKPDSIVEQVTNLDQAALYRLSGDLNPLHIDPTMAVASGFKKPILHGLATFGFSARHVLAQYGNNDPTNFKGIKVRFAKPVTPGETLQTEMWKEGNRVFFQTKTKESGTYVITGAYVDLKSSPASSPSAGLSSVALKSDAMFIKMKEGLQANAELAKSINGVFVYNILENGKTVKKWVIDLKKLVISEGGDTKGDVNISVADEDLIAIASGQLAPQAAFMKGKLKISGNIAMAQKLAPLLESAPKL